MGVDPDTLTNDGLIEALNGGTVLVGSNHFTNLTGTTLAGGSYEAGAGSTFEFVAFTNIVTDNAMLIVSGAGSIMEVLNANTEDKATIESMLTSTGSAGTLEILGGRDWTQSTAFSNAGTVRLGGGAFSVAALANSGTITGFGTIASAVSGTGAVIAEGGTLGFQGGSLSGISGTMLASGTIGADAGSTLQLGGSISIATDDGTIILNGSGAAIQSLNGASEVTLQSTLTTIGASGALAVLGDASYSAANAVANAGTIALGGGTFATGTLTDSASAKLTGFGTIASAFSDSGAVTASGGALVFTGTGDGFAGALSGTEIDLGGGTDLLQSGSSLASATLAIYGNALVTLAANQSFAGALHLGAGTINVGANTLSLSGTGSMLAGTVSGAGTLALTGGSQTIGSGTTLSVANWTLSGGDAVGVDASMLYASAFSAAEGTTVTIEGGDTLTLAGAATLDGTLTGAGKLILSGGADTIDAGAVLSTAGLTLSNGASLSIDGDLSYGAAINLSQGTTIAIGGGDALTLEGAGSILSGAVSSSGTLVLSGGSVTLYSGAALSVANWSLLAGARASLATNFSYAGEVTQAAGTTLSIGAHMFTLNGTGSTIAGTISGAGTLMLAGGSQTIATGADLAVSHWSLSGNDAATFTTHIAYAKVFNAGTGTSITIDSGDTLGLSGASTLAGTIGGAGTLAFNGGAAAVDSGATIGTADWSLAGGVAVTLNTSISFGGAFSQAAGSSLTLSAGDTLSITGSASLSGALRGAGTISLSNATLSGLVIGATVTLDDTGTIDQTGSVAIGNAGGEAATLLIASGNSYHIEGNYSIALGGAATSAIDDGGLLIKNAGTATSTIAVAIVDTGAIEAASGTLALTNAVSGTGSMTVDAGATLEITGSAAASLAMIFNGAGATLALATPSDFAATISGFAASDMLDLLKLKATGATVNAHDQLVITDGTTVIATLQLSGNYAGYSFTTGADGRGGTDITATAPAAPAHEQPGLADTFHFASDFGKIAVPDAVTGRNTFNLDHSGFAGAAPHEAHGTQDAPSEFVIAPDAHDMITLLGLSLHRFEATGSDSHLG
jgi:hypothetical protein